MKKLSLSIIFLVLFTILGCSNDKDYPLCFSLDKYPDTHEEISILAIGNSFTENAMDSLPSLLNTISTDCNISLYKATISSSTIEDHYNNLLHSESLYSFSEFCSSKNEIWVDLVPLPLNDILQKHSYHIIILQQFSGLSGKWDTIQPYLGNLIDLINYTLGYEPTYMWHMTWSYSSDSTHSYFYNYNNSDKQMYNEILYTTEEVLYNTPIDIAIPSAIMINILRDSNPDIDYTRDGYHIDTGIGNIALASLWYQTLIYPVTSIDVYDCFSCQSFNLSLSQVADILNAVNKSIKWEE